MFGFLFEGPATIAEYPFETPSIEMIIGLEHTVLI